MTRNYIITNPTGLHARPASKLVNAVSKFPNGSFIFYKGKRITLKSILAVMSLGIPCGEEVAIEVDGEDAEVVFQSIEKVLVEYKVIQ